MNLCTDLLVLAGDALAPAERNAAAARLMDRLRSWVPPYLRRTSPCALDAAEVDDVIQHLMTKSTLGTSRFRGASEGEAYKWCMRVSGNKARDLCRARKRLLRSDPEPEIEKVAPVAPDLEALAAGELERVLAALVAELGRLHRPQDLAGLERSLRCHVEARLGASIDEQLEAYGFASPDEPRAPDAVARARNRVYKYRERGRVAGCEALAALVAQGRFDDDDVADARQLLGCDLGAPVRKQKALLS